MKSLVFISIHLLFTLSVYSGPISSGGGGVFVCRDKQGQINHVEMIDLWEIKNIPEKQYTVLESNELPDVQIERALTKIETLAPTFAKAIRMEVLNQRNMYQPLNPGIRLVPPTDMGTPYRKEGCEVAGMLYYDSWKKRISYDPEYFSHLNSNTQIAAAYLHEAIYKILRAPPHENINSIFTRTIVGNLLSDYQFMEPITPIQSVRNAINRSSEDTGHSRPTETVLDCQQSNSNWVAGNRTEFYYIKYLGQTTPTLIFKRFDFMELKNTYVVGIYPEQNETGNLIHARNLAFSPYPYDTVGASSDYHPAEIFQFALDISSLTGYYYLRMPGDMVPKLETFKCKEFSEK
jgi:hypothetical protein